ncbi:sensor histidine kinase [Crassaminicella indica]|uniref:histidine kinase n=1 Tax=Crassaminicella indica TaxID=2855394 RepID=A0ABX8RCR6_9CLOT|nr:HAMP domain-containing sensor histidine kinase [Crassaminicella indica]QXM06848.1 HAMP domain-containing histidine kinase [Crassaminicella indica]
MKNSIRIKLFMALIFFTFMIVGLSWTLNTKYLEKYYLEKKEETLIKYGKEIKNMVKDNVEDINSELGRIENTLGGNIIIFSADGSTLYYSSFHRGGNGFGKMGIRMLLSSRGIEEVLAGNKVLETFVHPKFKMKFLVHAVPLEGNKILILETSVGAIKESVEIAKDFYVYIGMIALVLGTILAHWFSKRFTKPIVELNRVAKYMAKLDFSKKYNVKGKDEIAQLGETMNYLSDRLDHTISELNRANKKLQEDIERERKIDLMRKEFISSVSHELKTPIALIQGYAEGLKENVADEQSKDFYCEVIIDEAEKMGKMVKDLLELSKMESGNITIDMETFDIYELVEKVYNKYKPIFEEENIHGILEKCDEDLKVIGESSKIEQVLINFINNGINHIGGERNIKLSIKGDNEKVRISVYNTGEHIPEKELQRIWDSFYKLDKARNREYGGTGLGLSIVRGILKLHNSDFGVLNRENGVEFWFELRKGD